MNPEAVREQLQRIVGSPGFIHSERLRRFLTHCVEGALNRRLEDLKEYTIGVTAFDRPKDYNPSEDPIVRVEARRLRAKLDEYYQKQGASDPVVIQLPKGGYLPVFEFRAPPAGKRTRLRWIAGAAAALCLAAAAAWWFEMRRAAPVQLALSRATFDRGLTTDPALSVDGSLLAYASDRASHGGLDIWVQPIGKAGVSGVPRPVTNDEIDDSQPAISPDGSLLAFRSERQPPGVYVLPVAGGEPRLLAPDGRNPRFSPDGRSIVYWVGSPGGDSLPPAGRTYVMPASGGAGRMLAGNLVSTACPAWSPDGRSVLIEAMERPGDALDLWRVSLDGGRVARTGVAAVLDEAQLKLETRECSVAWPKDGSLVLSASSGDTENLWRLPVSRDAAPRGRLVRLTLGSADEGLPSVDSAGTIAFVSRTQSLNVWRMPVDRPDQLSRITQGGADITFPDVEGTRLAYLSKKSGPADLWLKDLHSGTEMQVTNSPVEPRYPRLCPDRSVVYSDGPNAFAATERAPGSRLLCNGCARVWQCNDEALFYLPAGAAHPNPVYQFRLPGGPGTPLLLSPQYDLANAQKSVDGWVAFHAITGAARRQIFVARYHAGQTIPSEEWIAATDGTNTDRNAVWNERADTLYFLSERCGFRCIWSQRLDLKTKRPIGGRPPSDISIPRARGFPASAMRGP